MFHLLDVVIDSKVKNELGRINPLKCLICPYGGGGCFCSFGIMELEAFEEIRKFYCRNHPEVTQGKMMSSPAIHYKNKVFAFLSRKNNMVFKLGKGFDLNSIKVELGEFSPFKTKKPLSGWYELGFEHRENWMPLTELALNHIKSE
ncbi:hypothetical protein [Flagellimonas allohymeniacidonis]|uniref:Uncharacterized protein n=1 Tax=Flagellimonas allohymeniacidonis TaxID=2517819 RepID=A0A4Q8QB11_9FLAO|nr:hypothetical protein [Allomuricauda hymeniacidonis]TAI47515.1 hypothetical protein EW142_12665 [Allomuricauda hymeniacidonis]